MKNYKKLFLIFLSVLIVAFVSCKDKGTDPTPFKVSDIAGNWSGEGIAFTIDASGNIAMTAPVTLNHSIPETDWNSQKTEYTVTVEGASITFKSATSGTASYMGESLPVSKQ